MTAAVSRVSTGLTAMAERRAVPLLTAGGASLAFVLAAQGARGQTAVVFLVLGVASGLAAIAWPRAAVIAVVAAVFLLPTRALPLGFAGIRTDIVEIGAFALLGLALLPGAARWRRTSPVAAPLIALAGAVAFGALVAALDGAPRSSIIAPAKTLLLYVLALPVLALVGDAGGRALLERWIHRLCVFGSVMTLVVAATGGALSGDGTDEVVTLGLASSAQRLRPGVLSLIFLATVLVVHELALRGASPARFFRLGLYVLVQLVSFNRSSWVPLVVAVVLYAALRPGARRAGRGLATVLIVGALTVALFTVASAGLLGPTATAVAQRARSVTNPEVFSENSYRLRDQEDERAWRAIRDRPLTGVGLGQPYGNRVRVVGAAPGGRSTQESLLLHNSILKAWLWLGIPGLLAFGWLGLRVAGLLRTARHRLAVEEGSRVVVASTVLVGLALRSIFQTSLLSRSTIFTVICAVVFVAAAGGDEGETS